MHRVKVNRTFWSIPGKTKPDANNDRQCHITATLEGYDIDMKTAESD